MNLSKKAKIIVAVWLASMTSVGKVIAVECLPDSQEAECLQKAKEQQKPNQPEQPPQPDPQLLEQQRQQREQQQRQQQEQMEQQQRQQRTQIEQQQRREQLEQQQQMEQQRQQRTQMEQQQRREQHEKQQQMEQQRQQHIQMEQQQQREQHEKLRQMEQQKLEQQKLEQQQLEQQQLEQQQLKQQKLAQPPKVDPPQVEPPKVDPPQGEPQKVEPKTVEPPPQQIDSTEKNPQLEQFKKQQQLDQQRKNQERIELHQQIKKQELLDREQLKQQQEREQQSKQQQQLMQERQEQFEKNRKNREHEGAKLPQTIPSVTPPVSLTPDPKEAPAQHNPVTAEQPAILEPAPPQKTNKDGKGPHPRPHESEAPLENLAPVIPPVPVIEQETLHKRGEGRKPEPVVINENTKVTKHDHGYTLNHKPNHGDEVMFHKRHLPDGETHLFGYQQTHTEDGLGGTRTYLDGRRISTGPKFVEYSDPLRPFDVITHHNGLREGFTHTGRQAFRESFTEIHRHNRKHKVIQRTINVTVINHNIVQLERPVETYYAIVPMNNLTVYSYYPTSRPIDHYDLFYRPMTITIERNCFFCPPPVIVYERPFVSYSDPIWLLSDMIVASSLYEGMNPVAMDLRDERINLLQTQLLDIQQDINKATLDNTDLKRQLADLQVENQELRQQISRLETEPVFMPDDIRKQIKKQVDQAMVAHKEGKTLSIADLIVSPNAKKHLFQVADTIDALNANSGTECTLTSGDLIGFKTVPKAKDSSASMRVMVSKKRSCPVGALIKVGFYDLQEMLNNFNQNLEKNMEQLSKHLSP